MSTVLIEVRGVLAKDNAATVGELEPVRIGFELLRRYSERWRIALSWDGRHEDPLWHWLMVNGVSRAEVNHVFLRQPTHGDCDALTLYASHLALLATLGPIEFVVTAAPPGAVLAMQRGLTAMLVCAPSYMRPEWRPDGPGEIRAWGEIEAEMTKQQVLKTTDGRVG